MKTLPTQIPIKDLLPREQLNKLLYTRAGMKDTIDARYGIAIQKPEYITNML